MLKWERRVRCMGNVRNAYRVLVGNREMGLNKRWDEVD
jgi:hypothetical protein